MPQSFSQSVILCCLDYGSMGDMGQLLRWEEREKQ